VGVITGIIGFFIGDKILKITADSNKEIVALIIALFVFVLSENFNGSGIIAVAVSTVLLSTSHTIKKRAVERFSSEIVFFFEFLVFGLLGAEFSFEQLIISRAEIITVIIALFFGRFISTMTVLAKTNTSLRERMQIALIAPKGIAPAALAPLVLGTEIIGGETIVKIVYYAIILSILFSLVMAQVLIGKEIEEKTPLIEKVKELREKKLKSFLK
jgi:NhaP-type Na+/H+ or K+/H+ antiporter